MSEFQQENQRNAVQTLSRIAELAASYQTSQAGNGSGRRPDGGTQSCAIKMLPDRLHKDAAYLATKINPVNAPLRELHAAAMKGIDPQRLTLVTAKYWGPEHRQLTVSFLESQPADLRDRIVSHLNAWAESTSLSFVQTSDVGDVRISLGPGGYWSYLGTDILLVPQDRQTMNLEGFSMDLRESEFHRVVRHEAGHTLGFAHEHMRRELVARIDREKAYAYFLRTQGWDRQTVDEQVLTPLDESSIMGTPPDEDSIMCYQLPSQITCDGQPIRGGVDINRTDREFAGKIYPPAGAATIGEWPASQDVRLAV